MTSPVITVEDPGSYCLSPGGWPTSAMCSQMGGCEGDHPTGKSTCVVVDGEQRSYHRTESAALRAAYRTAKKLGGRVVR